MYNIPGKSSPRFHGTKICLLKYVTFLVLDFAAITDSDDYASLVAGDIHNLSATGSDDDNRYRRRCSLFCGDHGWQ